MDINQYSPVWPHGEIKEVFPDVFFVMGTNVTTHNHMAFQHSRNMIIIRDKGELSLINTVRLSDAGLAALEALGQVKNIIRMGAFHGRDDGFYRDRYGAALWALEGMEPVDIKLTPNGKMPFAGCSLFIFESSQQPEGILHVGKEGGILITCDSIKNWVAPDEFFSDSSAQFYAGQDFFGEATISSIWLQACKVKAADFIKLESLSFNHLLSAHGEPLLKNAKQAVTRTIEKVFSESVKFPPLKKEG